MVWPWQVVGPLQDEDPDVIINKSYSRGYKYYSDLHHPPLG